MQAKTIKAAVVNLVNTSFFTFLFSLIAPPISHAQWSADCIGTTRKGFADVPTIKGLECAFSSLVSAILPLAGIILFIMLLTGGFRYLTSSGDPKAMEAAKGTLTQAITGLVVLLLAFVILQLIKTITGVDITKFQITRP